MSTTQELPLTPRERDGVATLLHLQRAHPGLYRLLAESDFAFRAACLLIAKDHDVSFKIARRSVQEFLRIASAYAPDPTAASDDG